ncbi:MAG: hypothetical protein IPI34_00080 [bacterium]|nr:hypothetical protein [bacterium]
MSAADLAHPADLVPLHAAVGDTVDAGEAARWGLFPDVTGLTSAVFVPGPRGGFLARLQVAGDPPGSTASATCRGRCGSGGAAASTPARPWTGPRRR